MSSKDEAGRRGSPWSRLPARAETKRAFNAVIETVQGSRCKFKLDEHSGVFKLGSVLPAGATFPYDFGFIPSTRAEDGDPIDVLLLMDGPTFAGCLVECRVVGVIEAIQKEPGERAKRNDRLIAVASEASRYASVRRLSDLDPALIDEIEAFFVGYNRQHGKVFRPIARRGPHAAQRLIKQAMRKRQRDR